MQLLLAKEMTDFIQHKSFHQIAFWREKQWVFFLLCMPMLYLSLALPSSRVPAAFSYGSIPGGMAQPAMHVHRADPYTQASQNTPSYFQLWA